MDRIPPWALDAFQKLPEPWQEKLQETLIKSLQNPYYISIASIPVAWALAYLPHFAKIGLVIVKTGDYFLDNPRLIGEEDRKQQRNTLASRLTNAHINSLEILPFYMAAVIIARVQKVNPYTLMALCGKFLLARVLYVVLYALSINRIFALARSGVWAYAVGLVFQIFGKAL